MGIFPHLNFPLPFSDTDAFGRVVAAQQGLEEGPCPLDPHLRHAVAEYDYKDEDDDQGYLCVRAGDLVSIVPIAHLSPSFFSLF